MTLEQLIEKGMVNRQSADDAEIKGSIALAGRLVVEAKSNMSISLFDVAFTLAYNSMFHSARALLFKVGYKERGHWALIAALKELYKDGEIQEYLNILDIYRVTRHGIQYDGDLSSELDSNNAIKDAEAWLKVVKKTLKVR